MEPLLLMANVNTQIVVGVVKSSCILSIIMIYLLRHTAGEAGGGIGAAVCAPHCSLGLHGATPGARQKRNSTLKYSYSLFSLILRSY